MKLRVIKNTIDKYTSEDNRKQGVGIKSIKVTTQSIYETTHPLKSMG